MTNSPDDNGSGTTSPDVTHTKINPKSITKRGVGRPKKRTLIPPKDRIKRLSPSKKDRLVDIPEDEELRGVVGLEGNEKSDPHPSPPQRKKSGTSSNTLKDKNKWRELFLDFISNLSIDSKESGITSLGDELYQAQYRFLDEVCAGLETNVRHFVCLKARQLGISTVSLAMDLFWMMVHPGMQGALITDTDGNKEKFRIIIDRYIESLPRGLRVGIKSNNRNNLVFKNGSVLDYLVAGTRKGGGLGRSRAYNFIHATECSSWGDAEGAASLMASLAEKYPDRLYIFESTARGFNLFHDMWKSAVGDPFTQRAIFIGWWAKEEYALDKDSPEFEKYSQTMSQEEQVKWDKTKKLYGVEVTIEQLSWYRWKEATRILGESHMSSEFPWTADEAFVATGKGFFPVKTVSENIQSVHNKAIPFEGYTYRMGEAFPETEVIRIVKSNFASVKDAVDATDLRIWEYPHEKGYYVIGVDPAYGRDEESDRSVIEVFRCYSDRLVQVAEYATPIPETNHLAWVLCHLAGNYKNCMINLELQGPGYAVMKELDNLKVQMRSGYFDRMESGDKTGISDFAGRSRWYLYHRPDSMGAGYVYNWKTTSENKQTIMNQTRDLYQQKQLSIKSIPLLEEMQTVVQDGVEIKASGRNKDDRVFAMALSVKAWIEWMRKPLMDKNMSYDTVTADEAEGGTPYTSFMQGIVHDFFKGQQEQREHYAREQSWDDD